MRPLCPNCLYKFTLKYSSLISQFHLQFPYEHLVEWMKYITLQKAQAIHRFQCYVARGIYCSEELLANLTYIAQAQSVFPFMQRRHKGTCIFYNKFREGRANFFQDKNPL